MIFEFWQEIHNEEGNTNNDSIRVKYYYYHHIHRNFGPKSPNPF
jgi:hypothetical protein